MSGNGWSEAVDVELERIDDEPARSMRAETLTDLAAEYAECLKDLPPIRVIAGPNDQHWCCDGCTRLAAYRLKGRKFVPCQIKRGTFEDAWREATRANTTHGARVTNRDKRAMVERALKRFPKMSDGAIAVLCSVSRQFVSGIHAKRQVATVATSDTPIPDGAPSTDDDYVVGRDGKRYPRKRPSNEAPKPRPRPKSKPELKKEVEIEDEANVEHEAPECGTSTNGVGPVQTVDAHDDKGSQPMRLDDVLDGEEADDEAEPVKPDDLEAMPLSSCLKEAKLAIKEIMWNVRGGEELRYIDALIAHLQSVRLEWACLETPFLQEVR